MSEKCAIKATKPITVRKSGQLVVLRGHRRLKALEILKGKE